MMPGDIRSMALKAAGFPSDAHATAAGAGRLVNAIEDALKEMRRLTVKEAAAIVRAHGPESAGRIERLIAPGDKDAT